MTHDRRRFEFAYRPGELACRPGCVADLEADCERHGWERALVVCGTTVGSTPAVMDPIRDGLGDRLAGVFDETTPSKYLGTAVEGIERARTADAVVDAVADVRDDLGLPDSLWTVDGLSRDDRGTVAARIADDSLLGTVPAGLDPTAEDVRAVLDAAWA
jgi:alcohol dehydrogenase